MSNSHGLDPLRLRQLRAMAGNLSSLANWHRENHNYVVADALYTRSLSITEQINGAGNDGDTLVARLRTGQQASFEMLRAGREWPREIPVAESTEGWLIEFTAQRPASLATRLFS